MGKGFLKGATIGAIIGAAAALLLAPKSGKEMRDDVKKMAQDLSKMISEKVSMMKEVSQESYERIVDEVVADYKKGKQVAEEEWDKVRSELKSKWGEVKSEMKKEED